MLSLVPRRSAAAALLSLAVLVSGGLPAAAVSPPNHEEPILSGDHGVHILIDGGEPYHAVTCHYQGSQLVGFRIRRPIALPLGSDQFIGWKYSIEGTDDPDPSNATWTSRYTSGLEKRFAADRQPAPFTTKEKQLGGLTKTWYRVITRMFWYRPSSHVDGKALISVESYQNDDGSQLWYEGCPSDQTLNTSFAGSLPPSPDEKYVDGAYGVNLLIDETDDWSFSGAGCSYQAGDLHRISIRRPIAFPTGSRQSIGWRYVVEGTNDTLDPFTASWNSVATGPLHKVVATPPQPAPFAPDAHTMSGTLSWDLYRVVVRVFWYKPTSTIVGRSYMAVESYDDGPNTNEDDSFTYGCPAQHP